MLSRFSPVGRHPDMPDAILSRPVLGPGLAVAEFDVWDWRKDELIAFAKTLGIPSRGTKDALTKRIRSQLGRVFPPTETVVTPADDGVVTPPALRVVSSTPVMRVPESREIAVTPARRSSVLPTGYFKAEPGQSRSQALAAWFATRNSRPR